MHREIRASSCSFQSFLSKTVGKTSQERGALNKRGSQIQFFPLGGDMSTSSRHQGEGYGSKGKSSILISRAGCSLALLSHSPGKLCAGWGASHLRHGQHTGREMNNQIPIHWAFAHLSVHPLCFPPPRKLGKQKTALALGRHESLWE